MRNIPLRTKIEHTNPNGLGNTVVYHNYYANCLRAMVNRLTETTDTHT